MIKFFPSELHSLQVSGPLKGARKEIFTSEFEDTDCKAVDSISD